MISKGVASLGEAAMTGESSQYSVKADVLVNWLVKMNVSLAAAGMTSH